MGEQAQSVQRWGDEHSAKTSPIGLVIYDDDDDLFTVKAKNGKWVVYSPSHTLRDSDIDADRGDQIVGVIEVVRDA